MEEKYLRRAIELAKRGTGFVNPNPLVGAVIVKNGRIIGEGYHERYGGLHAERNALANAAESPNGADIYVTLEPCCHYGKQPPCTTAIVEAGIKNVYIGSADPNPLVSGKGAQYLKDNGINVVTDILRQECDALNDIFFCYITQKRPYIILKAAMTIDGRTASRTGDARWISNELSRANVHLTRKRCAAIMVGIGTVLADDPMLDCRIEDPSDPVRVICDSSLRIPKTSKIMRSADSIRTIIATVSKDAARIAELEAMGAEVVTMEGRCVDVKTLIYKLGEIGLDSVLVEGGATLSASVLETGLVDKLDIYIAPKIIGGENAKPVIGGRGIDKMADAYMFGKPEITAFGNDILLEYRKEQDNVYRDN